MAVKKNSKSPGFTVIELLVTISVAGLLMSIAIPSYFRTLPGLRLGDAARQVATDLQSVRMKAIAQNIPYQVTFSSTSYMLQKCNGACIADSGNMALPDGITVTGSSPTQFQARGNVPADVTITLSNGTTQKWVCVRVAGRVRVQDVVCS